MSNSVVWSKGNKEITRIIFEIQQEVPFIGKDSDNPFFKSKYASLEDIWSKLKPVFAKHGLLVSQVPGVIVNGAIEIVTQLVHVASGEFVLSAGYMPMGKEGPQAAGSAITYARRYFLCPLLGIVAGEDDDAEAAEGRAIPAVKMGNLKARKEEALKWISARNNNVKAWMEDVLKREVSDNLILLNEAEVAKVEAAVNLLKKAEG